MKTKQFLKVAGLGSMLAGFSTQAALLGLQAYQTGPYYSDFSTSGLDVNYVYTPSSSTSGIGTFTVSNPYNGSGGLITKPDNYTSGTLAPGTLGADNGNFNGTYSLSATIAYNNGVATLTQGTFAIVGSLPGGISGTLLQGNLVTGVGGTAFGYVNNTTGMTAGEYNEFDFLINLSSLTGNSAIEADFLKSLDGTGGIILNAGFSYGPGVYQANNGAIVNTANVGSTSYQGFEGFWNQSFANPLAAGSANTFVPEPAIWPTAASLAAFAALALLRRKAGQPSGAC